MEVLAILKKKFREDKDRTEWALVSKKKPHKVLKWFGTQRPSDERVAKEEKRIQYFKHAKGSCEEGYSTYEQIKAAIKPLIQDEELYKQVKTQIKAAMVTGQAEEEKFDWITDTTNREAIQLERGKAQKLAIWIDFDASTAMQFVSNKEASDIQQNFDIVSEFKKKLLLINSGKDKPLLILKKAV